jgi:Cell division protein
MFFSPTGKVARGRENNLLIVYFTLSGQTAITVEGLHAWMEKKAEDFHRNPGTVTAGMRELIEAVNGDLYDRNSRPGRQNSQVTIHLQLAVVKNNMLYLANCGNGQSFFVGAEPQHLGDGDNANRGLGVSPAVSVRFVQSPLAENELLVMSFATPQIWTPDLMAGGEKLAMAAFARRLFSPLADAGHGVILRFLPGSGKLNYLNLAQAQAEPVQAVEEPKAPVSPSPEPQTNDYPFRNVGPTANAEAPAAAPQIVVKPLRPGESMSGHVRRPQPQTSPQTQSFQRTPAADATEEEVPSEPREPLIETDAIKKAVGKTLRGGAAVKDRMSGWTQDLMQKVAPGEPGQPIKITQGVLISIAIVVPILIAAIALMGYFHKTTSETPQYVALAQQLYQKAQGETSDKASQLADLQQAVYWLDKADTLGKSNDSVTLRNTVQTSLDSMQGIIRVDMASALGDGPLPGAKISQLVATDTNLYALDSNSGKVLRFTLNGSAYTKDATFDCGPNPKNPLNAIGNLVDMVPISPDNSYNATILAVDAKGSLDYCVPGDAGYVVKLSTPDMGWGAIQSISLSDDNLYVLDDKDNAVYRFEGNGVDFTDKPTLFFDDTIPPLADALDIEVIGYELYILRGNGQMVECTYSPIKDMKSTTCQSPAPFLDTRSGQDSSVNSFADAQFVQLHMTASPDSSLYLLDASKDSVYHFSYLRSLQRVLHPRMTDGTESDSLVPTAFTVSASRMLFIAYNNQIYYGQIP